MKKCKHPRKGLKSFKDLNGYLIEYCPVCGSYKRIRMDTLCNDNWQKPEIYKHLLKEG